MRRSSLPRRRSLIDPPLHPHQKLPEVDDRFNASNSLRHGLTGVSPP